MSIEPLNDELKQIIIDSVIQDIAYMQQRIQYWTPNYKASGLGFKTSDLDNLTYLAEQLKFKLCLLGGPRVY